MKVDTKQEERVLRLEGPKAGISHQRGPRDGCEQPVGVRLKEKPQIGDNGSR